MISKNKSTNKTEK